MVTLQVAAKPKELADGRRKVRFPSPLLNFIFEICVIREAYLIAVLYAAEEIDSEEYDEKNLGFMHRQQLPQSDGARVSENVRRR